MRRNRAVVLAIFTMLAISLGHGGAGALAAACSGTTLTVASASARPGESTTMAIAAAGVPSTGLAGFEFTVSYDPAIATVTGVQGGPGFAHVTANLQEANHGTVTVAGANAHGASGNPVLAILTVRAAAATSVGDVAAFQAGNVKLYGPEPDVITACPGTAGKLTVHTKPAAVQPPFGGDTPSTAAPAVAEAVTEPLRPAQSTSVSTGDGKLAVSVPAGAVDTSATMTVASLPEESQPQPGSGMVKFGDQVFQIVVEDDAGNPIRTFQQPLVLTFTYDRDTLPAGTSETDLQVFYWDEQLASWILVPSELDPTTSTISATVDHLTVFAVMAASGLMPPIDLKSHWAQADVVKLVGLGIVHGFDDGTFQPELPVTRAQFAKMLVEAKGLKQEAQRHLDFSDEIPDWAAGYVASAVKAGVVTGFNDNTFRPDDRITREQMALMAARALGTTEADGKLDFTDVDTISEWAQSGVARAAAVGIITGFADNTFRPQATATRAQAAAIISRLISELRRT